MVPRALIRTTLATAALAAATFTATAANSTSAPAAWSGAATI